MPPPPCFAWSTSPRTSCGGGIAAQQIKPSLHLLAEIRGDHLWIGAYRVGGAGHQQAAADADRDAVGARRHRSHIVLDQHHGELALEAKEKFDLTFCFLAADTGHRLVRPKQIWAPPARGGQLPRPA